MNPTSVASMNEPHPACASLVLRRWLAQPQLGTAPGWVDAGPVGHSPLRSRLAGLQLRRLLPAPEPDIDALQRWHPWLARPIANIEAGLVRAAALVLQRQIRYRIHGSQRKMLIDTLGVHLYQEVMQTQWQPAQMATLDGLRLPAPDWSERQQVLARGLRLAHDVLLHCSPYLAQRLLLLFPADLILPPGPRDGGGDAAITLVSTILQPEKTHDDH